MIAECENMLKITENRKRKKCCFKKKRKTITAWLMMIYMLKVWVHVNIKCYKKWWKCFIIELRIKKTAKWKIIYWNKTFLRTTKHTQKNLKNCGMIEKQAGKRRKLNKSEKFYQRKKHHARVTQFSFILLVAVFCSPKKLFVVEMIFFQFSTRQNPCTLSFQW